MIVYKNGGNCQRPGGTYSWMGVKDKEEINQALENGWFLTLAEAIEEKKSEKTPDIKEPESNDAPTRDELLMKAKELNLEFPKNIPTAKLLGMINEAMNGL